VLDVLNRTAVALASLDLEKVVQAVTDAGRELVGAQFGAFFYTVIDEAGEAFTLYTLSGASRADFERFGHPRATPVFAPTFRGEGVIRSANIREDARYGRMPPHHGMPPGHLAVTSYLAIPVTLRSGATIGGLFFGHAEEDVFTETSERLLVGLAAQAAVAVENARLFDEARRSAAAERTARAEVERASLLKDQFLATLSHELRTPLNAILGWAELLQQATIDGEKTARGVEAIARNARAQARLIDDLLDMSRIVSGKLRLELQDVDLVAVVHAAVESVRPAAEAKRIQLRTAFDPRAARMRGDPGRLQQIAWNLLANAVKFTPAQGTVDVVLARTVGHVELTVTDSGIGIDGPLLPHVFERFRQADSSPTRSHGGLGLGLAIVKTLVELHGGSVTAESPGIGGGATLRVRLPIGAMRRTSDRDGSNETQARVDGISLEGLSVLVVDDDEDARELQHMVLTGAGARVVLAASADEALTLLRSERPDVLVSDIGMPGKDGHVLIREVRRMTEAEGGRIPAIAVTAFARAEDRTRSLLYGYQVHLAKPVDRRELIAAVASLVGRASG
jgi:signal transduction histidine kinase/ActR/RegA family two-component response regulator